MSLLNEIQADVTKANADRAAVLRKCKALAVRLGSKDFQSWVDHEETMANKLHIHIRHTPLVVFDI